jgi:hypothetical protein
VQDVCFTRGAWHFFSENFQKLFFFCPLELGFSGDYILTVGNRGTPKMNDFATAVIAIQKMNNDELNAVVRAIKLRRTYLARQSANTFQVGDTVNFAARGMQVVGTVTKVNVKTVQVRQNNSLTLWKVHASLLSPVRKMSEAS